MARDRSSNDDATDRRLSLLVSLIVVSGAVAVAWAAIAVWSDPQDRPPAAALLGLVAAITVGSRTLWRMRIRSHTRGISWPEVGVLVGLTIVSPVWVVLCTALASAIAKFTARLSPQKALFGIAKDVLSATAAGVIFTAMNLHGDPQDPALNALALALATIAMWIVDESLAAPVLALATRSGIGPALRSNWDMRIFALVARYVVAVLVVAILAFDGDSRLLLLVAPVVLCVHLWQTGQVRSREERQSWQRLAQTTDELNVVDLTAVLSSAATRAAQLFSVDETDIEIRLTETHRLVRGTADGVVYDGSAVPRSSR